MAPRSPSCIRQRRCPRNGKQPCHGALRTSWAAPCVGHVQRPPLAALSDPKRARLLLALWAESPRIADRQGAALDVHRLPADRLDRGGSDDTSLGPERSDDRMVGASVPPRVRTAGAGMFGAGLVWPCTCPRPPDAGPGTRCAAGRGRGAGGAAGTPARGKRGSGLCRRRGVALEVNWTSRLDRREHKLLLSKH